MSFNEPVFSYGLNYEQDSDWEKLSAVARQINEINPAVSICYQYWERQFLLHAANKAQVEDVIDLLKSKFNLEVSCGEAQVAYKERFTDSCIHREVYKIITGGIDPFADIEFEIGPGATASKGLEFIDAVDREMVPEEFIPSVQEGFAFRATYGVLAGFPVESMRVRLFGGSYHCVDSRKLAFKLAAVRAFKNAAPKCQPRLIEPLMQLEIAAPVELTDSIIGDLKSRRAEIQPLQGPALVKAVVPLAEVMDYAAWLENTSSGKAVLQMTFSHYAEVPDTIAEAIIAQRSEKTTI